MTQSLFLIDLMFKPSPKPEEVVKTIDYYIIMGLPVALEDFIGVIEITKFETPAPLEKMMKDFETAASDPGISLNIKKAYAEAANYLIKKIENFWVGG